MKYIVAFIAYIICQTYWLMWNFEFNKELTISEILETFED